MTRGLADVAAPADRQRLSAAIAQAHRDGAASLAFTPADGVERLVALDAESGKVLWERRFSQYLSDVPQHRASWASPAVDPETGNIYVFTIAAQLICLAPDGKILWDRSLPDEYGAVTTHGGRTTSPIVDGDKVILNALVLAWGDLNRTGNRYFAFDKKTGQLLGAHMVGHEVTELIQGFVVAMNLETTEEELFHTIFPHPTISETMKEAVLDAYGRVLNM